MRASALILFLLKIKNKEKTMEALVLVVEQLSEFLMLMGAVALLSTIAFAALTFGLLDLAMNPVIINMTKIDEIEGKLKSSVVWLTLNMLICIFVIINLWIMMTSAKLTLSTMTNTVLILVISNFIIGIIVSIILKSKFKLAILHSNIIIDRLVYIAPRLAGNTAVTIINKLGSGLRYLMIMQYGPTSIIINLLISILIAKFMIGKSEGAGNINMIGSIIGGLLHFIIRANYIKEQKQILKGDSDEEISA
jgi:hypothetical protein